MMTTLLLDPQLGPASWGAVAEFLGAGATAWPASTVKSVIGSVQAEQVLQDILNDEPSYATAVGWRFGCAVAAALVRQRRAQRAILIDPPALLTGSMELNQAGVADIPVERKQAAEKRMMEFLTLDPAGPWPLEFYLVYAIQLTDDPSLQEQYAAVWKRAEEQRQPHDLTLSLRPSRKSSAALNWLSGWADPTLDIVVWLPVGRPRFRDALAALAPDRPLSQMPWGPLVWLGDPEQLAADLAIAL